MTNRYPRAVSSDGAPSFSRKIVSALRRFSLGAASGGAYPVARSFERDLGQPSRGAHGTIHPRDVADETFATPEEAAVADFPPQYVRVESITYSGKGNRAKVALLTNQEPYLYRYYVNCERDENGRWGETSSSN